MGQRMASGAHMPSQKWALRPPIWSRRSWLPFHLTTMDTNQRVRALAHRVMVMKDGQVVESGSLDEVLNQPKSQYTRTLIEAAGSAR